MIDARLNELLKNLHFDINILLNDVDSGKCNNNNYVLRALSSLIKYADEKLDEI